MPVFPCNWMALNKCIFIWYHVIRKKHNQVLMWHGILGQTKEKQAEAVLGKHLDVSSLLDQNAENSIHPLCPCSWNRRGDIDYGILWLFGNKCWSYSGGRSTQWVFFYFLQNTIPQPLLSQMDQFKGACITITLVGLISQMERQSITWIISSLCKDYCTRLHYRCNLQTSLGCSVFLLFKFDVATIF